MLNEHARSSDGSAHVTLPPITAATCLLQLVVFFKPGGVLLSEVSLSPYCVVDKKQYYRLITAAFVHVDATHLITNLTAAVPDCIELEQQCGSAALAADLAVITLTSHALYVGFAWLQKIMFYKRYNYYSLVTVGFSGVLFGLKVWAGFKRGGAVYIWGVPVPSRFSWVPTLALTHLCAPEASFPAHIAGVAAGILRAYCWEPVLTCLRHGWGLRSRSRPVSSSITGSASRQSYQAESAGLTSGSRPGQYDGQSLQQDWRQLHHARWQQQQRDHPINSSTHQEPEQNNRIGGGPVSAVAAGSQAQQQQRMQPMRFGGDRLSARRLLIDAGLQAVLAAVAAGLYFAVSRDHTTSRSGLRATFLRR
eukprot:GHUV01022941.1.p1 GENE.GHUV01022941.1~~GHUV01022941.1.p1  ORF type:complete len:364 (+),score=118.20 GHUV01022941.1:297-1388(+)